MKKTRFLNAIGMVVLMFIFDMFESDLTIYTIEGHLKYNIYIFLSLILSFLLILLLKNNGKKLLNEASDAEIVQFNKISITCAIAMFIVLVLYSVLSFYFGLKTVMGIVIVSLMRTLLTITFKVAIIGFNLVSYNKYKRLSESKL